MNGRDDERTDGWQMIKGGMEGGIEQGMYGRKDGWNKKGRDGCKKNGWME